MLRTDGRSGPTARPAFAKATQVITSMQNRHRALLTPSVPVTKYVDMVTKCGSPVKCSLLLKRGNETGDNVDKNARSTAF